jgi:hypothetical protein
MIQVAQLVRIRRAPGWALLAGVVHGIGLWMVVGSVVGGVGSVCGTVI